MLRVLANKMHEFNILRDRVKASLTEEQEWETEEDGVDLSFDMDSALEGIRL